MRRRQSHHHTPQNMPFVASHDSPRDSAYKYHIPLWRTLQCPIAPGMLRSTFGHNLSVSGNCVPVAALFLTSPSRPTRLDFLYLDLPPESSQFSLTRPTTVYGRYHYLRNVDGQPVKAHRTSYSCIVTIGATKRTSRESSVLWEPHGWPLVSSISIINRFTPTCVGTAGRELAAAEDESVHPHVRGDGDIPIGLWVADAGSPPRAWGRRYTHWSVGCGCRFTPTCVGTALVASIVHSSSTGSPPRAWGRPRVPRVAPASRRFTPTCVGTADSPPAPERSRSVHPHVRGDGPTRKSMDSPDVSSPPRAWGRLGLVGLGVDSTRFTPTCVGTARYLSCVSIMPSVHPHVRGDGWPIVVLLVHDFGSPPRAWGRRCCDHSAHAPIGSPPRAWGRRSQ